jgi:hypothetical protein
MTRIAISLLAAMMLGGCGIEQVIQDSDERYLLPGALDSPLSGYYDTYSFKFLDRYRLTHEAPVDGGCRYHGVTALASGERFKGRVLIVRDIFEDGEKTWQRSEGRKPLNLDRYVRSVKILNPLYGNVNGVRQKTGDEEIEAGLQSLCFKSWYLTSHTLIVRLHKRDVATWRAQWSEFNPQGHWSQQQVGNNLWWVLENDERGLSPQPPGATGGWFQSWLLPIGDTDYVMSMQLGANQKSLQLPATHERMKATLRHMVESVKVESLP